MFDASGRDNNTYNVDNFEFIKKTSPVVGGFIEKEDGIPTGYMEERAFLEYQDKDKKKQGRHRRK